MTTGCYNKYDDTYVNCASIAELKQSDLLLAAQHAINRYFLSTANIGKLTMDELATNLHFLPAVTAYLQPAKSGLIYRKYHVHHTTNKEIQSYLNRNY